MDFPVLDTKRTGAKIKELREKRNIGVEEVSEYMGFSSNQAVYKWQRGDTLPTVDNLYALSKLFDVSIDEILQGA